MPYYRDADGNVLFFNSIAFAHELPAGARVISDAEALADIPTPLGEIQNLQIQQIDDACAAAIVGGFNSSALGAVYHYPAKTTDQANLNAAVQRSMLPGFTSVLFWCADRYGNWAMRGHNAAQIQQVGIDGFNWISKCIAQKAQLEVQVMMLSDPAAIAKIVWSNPT